MRCSSKNNLVLSAALFAWLAAAVVLSVFCGPARVSLSELGQSGILWLRISRTVLAIVVGAGLSVAGVIFQAILRNPLAEPYVLGVSSGSAIGAASAIIFGLGVVGAWTVPAAAFGGALVTIIIVYAVAREPDGTVPVHTLLLSGVIVSAVLGSFLMFVISVAPSEGLRGVLWWLLGSLQVFDGQLLLVVGTAVVIGLAIAVRLAGDLNPLTLGDEKASLLGMDVERARRRFFLLASLLTGATVAACGLIGFIGLMVPHAVRLAIGPDHRRLVPACAVAGAGFLVLADCIARTVVAPREVPIGVITALAGGPFFLMLLRRRKLAGWR